MTRKLFNFKILLIYFILLIPWPYTHVKKIVCSIDNSRLVRKIVRAKWQPILDKYHVQFPLECPLHPMRDVFAPRQEAKKRDRPTQWTCRLCGKSFYEEKFLDLHFQNRHKAVINDVEDAVCLAELCDILRCEVFQPEETSSLKYSDQHIITDVEVWSHSLGQNVALAKANAAYLSLLPLRTSSIASRASSKFQSRQLCHDKGQNKIKNNAVSEILTANEPNTDSSDFSEKRKSTLTSTDETQAKMTSSNQKSNGNAGKQSEGKRNEKSEESAKVESSNDTAHHENRTTNGNGTHSQKILSDCKTEELYKLKLKCERFVHGCIGSLLLTMNDQSFKEMEEEMSKAVCWYLSCDRYWEDGPLEPRAFPWCLIFILTLVLSTGICFCYYIIWILFDSSEETTIMNNANYQYQHLYMHHPYQGYSAGGPAPLLQTPAATHGLSSQQQQQKHSPGPSHHPHQSAGHYCYQQPESGSGLGSGSISVSVHDSLYPETGSYDYRHSPRQYIGDQRLQAQHSQQHQQQQQQQGTPTMCRTLTTTDGGRQTPTTMHHQHSHHATNLAYQQDILDRRDYTSSTSRPIATTAVTNDGHVSASAGHSGGVDGQPRGNLGSVGNVANASAADSAADSMRHYNTHPPRPLDSYHRHSGSSQQSLRGNSMGVAHSSSSHEIIQNEIGHNEHYIYVTYPPDLKKRYFEKYE